MTARRAGGGLGRSRTAAVLLALAAISCEGDLGADAGVDGVWMVRAGAAPGGDGHSWEAAFSELRDAQAVAATGEEIWVAAGTYLPTADGGREVSFTSRDGVALYGGFLGHEGARHERDWIANGTVLSGDIGVPGDDSDNSHRVIVLAHNTRLDGFHVTGGNADGSPPYDSGGGATNETGSTVIANCLFFGNRAVNGGAVHLRWGTPQIANCVFAENRSLRGGAIHGQDSAFTVVNSRFDGNSAESAGGAIHAVDGDPVIVGCAFRGNSAAGGGAIHNEAAGPTVAGCAFENNAAVGGGAIRNWNESHPRISSSVFHENLAEGNGGAIDNNRSSPTVTDCVFSGNSAGGAGGVFHSWNDSHPVLSNCSLFGNSAAEGGATHGTQSGLTASNCIIWGNSSGDDLPIRDRYLAETLIGYSCVQGGFLGEGNLDGDPLFFDAGEPAGPDGIWRTADDGLRPGPGSPCIDAANGDAAPEFDILTNPRWDDAETLDTGVGAPPFADIGAYEYMP